MPLPQIIAKLCEINNCPDSLSHGFINKFAEIIENALLADGVVDVRGLGTFQIIDVLGEHSVEFAPYDELAEAVNAPFSMFEPVELDDAVTDEMLEAAVNLAPGDPVFYGQQPQTSETPQQPAPEPEACGQQADEPLLESADESFTIYDPQPEVEPLPESQPAPETASQQEIEVDEGVTIYPYPEEASQPQHEPLSAPAPQQDQAPQPNHQYQTQTQPQSPTQTQLRQQSSHQSSPENESQSESSNIRYYDLDPVIYPEPEVSPVTDTLQTPHLAVTPEEGPTLTSGTKSEPVLSSEKTSSLPPREKIIEKERVVKVVDESPRRWVGIMLTALVALILGIGIGFFAHNVLNLSNVKSVNISADDVKVVHQPAEAPEEVATDDDSTFFDEDASPSEEAEEITVDATDESAKATPADAKAVVTDTVKSNRYLTTMARQYYGKTKFWVYIYQENSAKLADPDRIAPNTVVIIPPAEKYNIKAGDPKSEADADRLAASLLAKKH